MTTPKQRPRRHDTRATIVPAGVACTMLGVTARTLQRLVAAGILPAPVQRGCYDLAAVVAAYLAHRLASADRPPGAEASTAELRRRKLRLEIEDLELSLGARRRSLIETDRALAVIAADYAACRARLLGVPTKCAPIVLPMTELEPVRAVLQDAIEDALAELSSEDALVDRLGA